MPLCYLKDLTRLLREVDLTLDRAVAICRADETAERCGKEFEKQKNVDKVKVKSTKSPSHYSKPPNKQGSSTSQSVPMFKYDCKFCGRKHLATKESCPAYGQECRNCRQENHSVQRSVLKCKLSIGERTIMTTQNQLRTRHG